MSNWGIKGFQGVTLLDYPGRVASLIFIGGCNFRCPFCHNPSLVLREELSNSPTISEDRVLQLIAARRKLISGVVISGGEPTCYEGLAPLMRRIKSLGLLAKLDTNGSKPEVLKMLLHEGLADLVAIDIKTSPAKYPMATGGIPFQMVEDAISLAMDIAPQYLFRTTLVPGLVEGEDLEEIGVLVEGASFYQLQSFRPGITLNPAYSEVCSYPRAQMEEMAGILSKYVKRVELIW